jgi:hypothetical protein
MKVTWIAVPVIALVTILSAHKSPDTPKFHNTLPMSSDPDSLKALLYRFSATEMAKDATHHRELFAPPLGKMNFILMNHGTPSVASLGVEEWIRVFTTWAYDYCVDYSEIEFETGNGVAVDSHHFQGYKNGVKDIHGTDLFMFIRTVTGWKIISVSSSIFNPGDSVDYSIAKSVPDSPEMFLQSVVDAINQHDKEKFVSGFLNSSTPCLRFARLFTGEYNAGTHGADDLFNSFAVNEPDCKLILTNIKLAVKDHYLALGSSEYFIKDGYETVEVGKVVVTMVLTPSDGWKISGMVLSIMK